LISLPLPAAGTHIIHPSTHAHEQKILGYRSHRLRCCLLPAVAVAVSPAGSRFRVLSSIWSYLFVDAGTWDPRSQHMGRTSSTHRIRSDPSYISISRDYMVLYNIYYCLRTPSTHGNTRPLQPTTLNMLRLRECVRVRCVGGGVPVVQNKGEGRGTVPCSYVL
jgi:hypothetical protein